MPVESGATRLGRFTLLNKLGAGGMGEVFAAYDEKLDRRVAVKLIHSSQADSHDARARLLREAQALARLSHPNVVGVYEVGDLDGEIFVAMEYIDGTTLKEWQEAAGREVAEILDVYAQAGRGLEAAHEAGLVHRDFKPSNVMVGRDGRARVLDFGLAHGRGARAEGRGGPSSRQAALGEKLTFTGEILGTPAYASPEQLRGEAVDAQSDQFSFCVALYEALYRRHPFAAEAGVGGMRAATLAGRVAPPPAVHEVPPAVHEALARGMSVEPGARWPDMEALLSALGYDPAWDPSAQRQSRLVFIALVLGSASVAALKYVLAGAAASQTPESLLRNSLTMLAAAVLGVLLLSRTLLRNRFHRRMVFYALTLLVFVTASRELGILRGETAATIMFRDLLLCGIAGAISMVWGGGAGRPAVAWLCIAIPCVGAVAMTVLPSSPVFIGMLSLYATMILYVLVWYHAARVAARGAPDPRSGRSWGAPTPRPGERSGAR
jgi:predicted Ser/Thr protein kinase